MKEKSAIDAPGNQEEEEEAQFTAEELRKLEEFTPDPNSLFNLDKQKRRFLAYLPGGDIDQLRARNRVEEEITDYLQEKS